MQLVSYWFRINGGPAHGPYHSELTMVSAILREVEMMLRTHVEVGIDLRTWKST